MIPCISSTLVSTIMLLYFIKDIKFGALIDRLQLLGNGLAPPPRALVRLEDMDIH